MPGRLMFQHMVPPAQVRQILEMGLTAERGVMGMIEVALPSEVAAGDEATPFVPTPQLAFQLLARAVSVDGEHPSSDRVGEHPIPA